MRIITTNYPTAAQKADILTLVADVAAKDGIVVTIAAEDFPPGPRPCTFMMAIEADTLCGVAAMTPGNEPETTFVVAPSRRRKGIATQLLAEVRSEQAARGLTSGLLVGDLASPGMRPFLDTIGATEETGEFRMVCSARPATDLPSIPKLELRRATPSDVTVMSSILQQAFDHPIEQVTVRVEAGLAERDRYFLLAVLDGLPVGLVRLGAWDGMGDITSLAVMPEVQGRGIGKILLLVASQTLFDQGFAEVGLDVATTNQHALGLYESVGYRVTNAFGFFRLATETST